MQRKIAQHQRNLDALDTALKVSDTALGSAYDIVEAAKRVALGQTSGTSTAESRAVASRQIDNAFAELRAVANSTFNGAYVFSGFQTGTPPYDAVGAYQGDAGVMLVEVSPGVTIARNIPGETAFGSTGVGVDIFTVLADLKTAIDANDQAGILTGLTALDQAKQQLALARADAGVRLQAVDAGRDRLRSLAESLTQIQSDLEHIDLTEAVAKFQVQQVALQATQEASARILQNSLLDFLK
jgi:flagellar hook-associated protein 3 FlgL